MRLWEDLLKTECTSIFIYGIDFLGCIDARGLKILGKTKTTNHVGLTYEQLASQVLGLIVPIRGFPPKNKKNGSASPQGQLSA